MLGVWESERVGIAPLLVTENKDLNGSPLPHDPDGPVQKSDEDTYAERRHIRDVYGIMAVEV
jgi:hypothetical protein